MNPFAQALLDIAIEEGSTASLEALRNKAFLSMAGGDVKTLVSSSLNGKTATLQVSKAADVLFSEVSWAIRQFNIGNITNLRPDFTLL